MSNKKNYQKFLDAIQLDASMSLEKFLIIFDETVQKKRVRNEDNILKTYKLVTIEDDVQKMIEKTLIDVRLDKNIFSHFFWLLTITKTHISDSIIKDISRKLLENFEGNLMRIDALCRYISAMKIIEHDGFMLQIVSSHWEKSPVFCAEVALRAAEMDCSGFDKYVEKIMKTEGKHNQRAQYYCDQFRNVRGKIILSKGVKK